MKRRIFALIVLAVLALTALGGCASAQTATEPSGPPTESGGAASATPAPADFPVTVTDAAGREVTIEAEPQSLVSGYYITTSMLIALGQRDKVIGLEAKADTRPIYSLAAPGFLALPSVGTAREFDLEGCAALEPDLVILPLRLKDSAQALEALGITVLTVNPESLSLLDETIEMLGLATGSRAQAEALLAYNRDTAAELEALLAGLEKPRVYLAGNSGYLSTAGAQMYQHTLIEMAGGENAAAELEDSYWAEISYEQLLAWNPQVIIIAPGAQYSREDLMGDAQLAALDAVKNGLLYTMPSGLEAWDSPVPSALVGSRWIASVLHGEAYPFETFMADAAEFYSSFYDIAVDQTLLTR